MTPLERAARALQQADEIGADAWEAMTHGEQMGYLIKARAVLTAIREPSEAMDFAAAACESSYIGDVYTAMIDAALAEEK